MEDEKEHNKEVTRELYDSKMAGRAKKRRDWWNGELKHIYKEKKCEYEQWQESKTVESESEYARYKNTFRNKVKQCKGNCNVRWEQQVSEFHENKE